VNQVGVASHYH